MNNECHFMRDISCFKREQNTDGNIPFQSFNLSFMLVNTEQLFCILIAFNNINYC